MACAPNISIYNLLHVIVLKLTIHVVYVYVYNFSVYNTLLTSLFYL